MIRGYFDREWGMPVPAVQVALFIPTVMRRWSLTTFLIDTGSTASVIHPGSAVNDLGLDPDYLNDPARWPDHAEVRGVGGQVQHYTIPAELTFAHEDGTLKSYAQSIQVAPERPGNEGLPSLLGWDILRHFRLTVDWRSRTVTLEE